MDRDYDSNDEKIISRTLSTFKNSMDNDFDVNGILLLSYLYVESYEISRLKQNMHRSMNNIGILNCDPSYFYKANKRIFEYEKDIYDSSGKISAKKASKN